MNTKYIATEKSEEIENLLTELSGTHRPTQVSNNLCAWCKGTVTAFNDPLSEREYVISGMCQKCQDELLYL